MTRLVSLRSLYFARAAVPAILLTVGLGAAGCSCGDESDNPTSAGTPGAGPGAAPGGGGGAGGAGGGAGVGGGDGTLSPSAVVLSYASPFDATLSKDGSVVYFTAIGEAGPGVFSAPAGGG